MKNFAIALILVLSVAMAPAPALAQTDTGPTPGSFWYGITTTFENVNLFFTFNAEKKAEKALGYAERRLAQATSAAENENTEAVEIALADYEAKITLASESSKKIKNDELAEKLFTSIADNISKHQETLSDILEKVPEEAREAIAKAIEVSKREQEEARQKITELKDEIEQLKQEVAALRAKEEERKDRAEESSARSTPTPTPKPIEVQEQAPKISTTPLSNSQIIKKIKPAVVYIETDAGTGSGMVISSDGFILTNAHVVQGSATAQITLSSGRIYLASVVGRDENVDLAVLKINVQNLPTVELGDSSATEQGDEVFTLGYPFGIKGDVSFKEGTISRKIADGVNTYLETSAEIHPGNSGGPLVNARGNVIGVNSASFGQNIKGITVGETIKFAIPINIAKNLIPELKAGRQVIVPKTESPSIADPFQTEDSNLKIAKCQAKRDADYSTFVSKTDQMIADAIQKIKDEAKTFIDKQLQNYDACLIERPDVLKQYDSTMSPYDLCSFYLRNAEAKKSYTDQLIAKTRASRDTFLPQGKAAVDNEYYQCVNR